MEIVELSRPLESISHPDQYGFREMMARKLQ
jgi:hypothetical protein